MSRNGNMRGIYDQPEGLKYQPDLVGCILQFQAHKAIYWRF